MKYLFSLIVLISLFGCSSFSEDNNKNTNFHYGQLVIIKKGFYQDYRCIVLREYTKDCSIFCKIAYVEFNGTVLEVQDEYKNRINLSCDDVKKEK